jgi:RNA polymerase sigma factor for flagellar operon FliA
LHDHNATKVLFFDDLGLDDDFFYHSLFQNALNPMQQAQMSELHLLIKEMLTKIDPKESLVLQLYFHEEKQLRDIAALLHVSESRISQMISSAIKRLKTLLQSFDV